MEDVLYAFQCYKVCSLQKVKEIQKFTSAVKLTDVAGKYKVHEVQYSVTVYAFT
jgi:hypothetical protein